MICCKNCFSNCEKPGDLIAHASEAYAHRAAVRLAFDWRRTQQNCRAETNSPSAIDPRESSLVRLVRQEQVEEVLYAMSQLSCRAQQVLTLRYIEQQSYETIAEQLGRTPHQIRAVCHKALVQLRRLVRQRTTRHMESEGHADRL